MVSHLLMEVFQQRQSRGYVGKHRAPRERYVARVPMQATSAELEPTSGAPAANTSPHHAA